MAVAQGPSPLAAQQGDDEVRVFRQRGGPGGEVTLVVTTPPAVIGAALPDSAFTVLQGGTPRPAEVVPYSSGGLEIALVLGARSSASLNAEQESGAEFLRFLGGDSRIAVVDASEPRTLVEMTDDGDRVGQALLEVENASSSEPTSEAAVEAALDEFSDDARRKAVVLMTDDDGAVSPGLAGRLVEAGARARCRGGARSPWWTGASSPPPTAASSRCTSGPSTSGPRWSASSTSGWTAS
jgi:hypothetical protein